MQQFPEYKRTKGGVKKWDSLFKKSIAKDSERLEKKDEHSGTLSNLRYEIDKEANDLKMTTAPDERHSFENDEFFFRKAWDEFCKYVMEDFDELMDNSAGELIHKKERTKSEEEKIKYFERQIKKKQNPAQETIEKLIPGFSELEKYKKLDLLDDLYEKLKKGSYFIRTGY